MTRSNGEGATSVTSTGAPYNTVSSLTAYDFTKIGTNTTQVQYQNGFGLTVPVTLNGSGSDLVLLHGREVAEAVENDRAWFASSPTRRFRWRFRLAWEFNCKADPAYTLIARCRDDLRVRLEHRPGLFVTSFCDHEPDDQELEEIFLSIAPSLALNVYFAGMSV